MYFSIKILILSISCCMCTGLATKTTTYTGSATWYELGQQLTACGQSYTNEDIVVAVSGQLWGSNADHDSNVNHDPMCSKSIIVSDADNATSSSTTILITDECGSCALGDLDLSKAAFVLFRDLSVGRFSVRWEFS